MHTITTPVWKVYIDVLKFSFGNRIIVTGIPGLLCKLSEKLWGEWSSLAPLSPQWALGISFIIFSSSPSLLFFSPSPHFPSCSFLCFFFLSVTGKCGGSNIRPKLLHEVLYIQKLFLGFSIIFLLFGPQFNPTCPTCAVTYSVSIFSFVRM